MHTHIHTYTHISPNPVTIFPAISPSLKLDLSYRPTIGPFPVSPLKGKFIFTEENLIITFKYVYMCIYMYVFIMCVWV